MPFVKSYDFDAPSRFRRLASANTTGEGDGAGDVVAVGTHGRRGLVVRARADGTVVWSRTYLPFSFPSPTVGGLSFIDVMAVDGGDFVILATPELITQGPTDCILLRITGSGTVRWTRRLSTQWQGATRMLHSATSLRNVAAPEILVVGWGPRTSDRRDTGIATLVRLDPNGELLGSTELTMAGPRVTAGAGRVFDAVAVHNGYVLIGDARDPRSTDEWTRMSSEREVSGTVGICIKIGLDLIPHGAWTVNANLLGSAGGDLSPRAALLTSFNKLSFTGCITSNNVRRTFAAALPLDGFPPPSAYVGVYDVLEGTEQPIRMDRLEDDVVILAAADYSGLRPRLLRVDPTLAAVDLQGLDLGDRTALVDLRANGPGSLAIAGVNPERHPVSQPILVAVDEGLACCRATSHPLPQRPLLQVMTGHLGVEARTVEASTKALKMAIVGVRPTVASLCGVDLPSRGGERMVQSPHLNLQAAGSDGTAASKGVLLRWFLDGALSNHLPKGHMAQNTYGFNKPNDFVTIYRARWPAAGVASRGVSFVTDRPAHVDNARRKMFFLTGAGPSRDLLVFTFGNASAYATAKQAKNPMTDPGGFIRAYGANPFEVEVTNALAVACDLTFLGSSTGFLQVETRSVGENRPTAPRKVTSRRKISPGNAAAVRLFAENMRGIRIKCTAVPLKGVSFLCYDDVLSHVNKGRGWTKLGEFALTVNEPTAFRRLEDPGRFQVHGHWRKFNDGACVNVANHKARWTDPADGLAAAVQTYRQLSETNWRATRKFQGTAQEDGEITLSYLDMLQLASFDYHVARMLGLGHVDADATAGPYVHVAEYVTLADLRDGGGARQVQHLYMSLPTALGDARLPLVPDLDGVEYGLSVPTGSGVPYQLTDAQGYTPDGQARYIKLYPGCVPLYEPEHGFFDPPALFDLSKSSLPVVYGVEYRAAGEAAWHKPEIAHDVDFEDTRSPPVPEILTTPFPASQRESAFIHKETEPGVHEYAVFAVNLFSRPSALSTVRATDATAFRRRNTLLPPSDLQVQYIQKESTLVLTTSSEQAMLPTGGDKTLVRVCFNYGFAQEANYEFADKVEILHRREIPRNVVGGIKAIGAASDPAMLRIELKPYTYADGQTASPILTASLKPNFMGGVLVGGSRRLVIEGIEWPQGSTNGANPIFIVRKPTTTGVTNNSGTNTLVIQDVTLDIHPGDLVMAVENMAAAVSWGVNDQPGTTGAKNPLGTTIALGDPSWNPQTRIESFARPDGKIVTRKLRGVWAGAQISAIPAAPGRYKILFDAFVLGQHPQSGAADPVSWWKGTVRVPVAGRDPEDRRTLVVTHTFTTQGGKFALEAVDDTGEQGVAVTGPALVNYYPGYKVYLHADSAHGFDQTVLEPASGEGSRTTVIGVRSVDNDVHEVSGALYRSAVGAPQLVTAVEILTPMPPRKPKGLKYATPPDGYGKSSYALTIDFDHKPFALAVYRADALSILEALYHATNTLPGVVAALFPPSPTNWFVEHFEDLFAFSTDARTSMSPIPAAGGYTLPNPDAPVRRGTGPPLSATDKGGIRKVLLDAFVPLTEQPLIYDLISTDPTHVPTNRKQSFRDANGGLLSPQDPAFDLAPVAKRPGTGNSIQFVDFTLDGSMNPNTLYFYFAREIGNRMDMSDPSPIFGPVKLVNLTAPPPPSLRKICTVPFDSTTGDNPAVEFEIVAPSVTDPMAKLRIYRTTDPTLALSVRTMQLIKVVDLATLPTSSDGTLTVADDFGPDPTIPYVPDPFIPYGEPLFYRLTWIREVSYDDAAQVTHVASVPSEPTRTLLSSIIDVVNPTPPTPTVKVVDEASNGDKFLRVGWSKTVHNGTYYASRLDPSGSWTRLASITTNDATAFYDLQEALPVDDEDDNLIYYRFKVDVEGPSGLLNTTDKPVIVTLDKLSLV